jgi:Major Facilitator Superfamily
MLVALFVLTFLESIAATLIQRGVYFYTHEHLRFGDLQNLWVAFGFGVTYVAGALLSHKLSLRLGERRLLLSCLSALLLLHGLLAAFPAAWVLVSCVLGTALVQGVKWPVIESYVSAGRAPKQLLPILGRYNVTWATACFVAVGVTGAIVGAGAPSLFFWLPALLNVGAIALARRLPEHPLHLDHGHPARPAPGELARMRALLGSARWSMICSYALLFVLAPLMPSLLAGLKLPVALATPVASVLDGVRVLTFGALGAFAGWHGRRAPLWLTLVALPAGFLLIVLGGSLPLVLAGEIVFGVAAGFAYTAALYYALVTENGSVDAGGAHEGLIGLGFGLGPLSALAGQLLVGKPLPLSPSSGLLSSVAALTLATLPIMTVCFVLALRPLFRPPGHRG